MLNSGNANAATGEAGRRDALRMCELTGEGLGVAVSQVLVCSTGLIGIPMPMAPVEAGIPKLCAQVSESGGADAAHAIMTTDTVPKEAVATAGPRDRRWNGEGRSDALARDGDHARGRSPPMPQSITRPCSARWRPRCRTRSTA